MEVQNQEVLGLVAIFDLLPLLDLFNKRIFTFQLLKLVVFQTFDPIDVGKNRLNRIFLHKRDCDVEVS